MSIANAVVSGLLQSPLHRVLSGSTDLIRYTGRRSGREITTPTQYARHGDDVIIVVGRPGTKTWWRNFRDDGEIDVLLQRQWQPMIARSVVREDEPETFALLLEAYLQRFPRAAKVLRPDARRSGREGVVVIWCRPR